MAAGAAYGWLWPGPASTLTPVSNIFISLIKSIIAPLLFGLLVTGASNSGGIRTMGRIGIRTAVYFEIVTALALLVGIAAANLLQPGSGLQLQPPGAAPVTVTRPNPVAFVENSFPASIIDAMVRGDVLQIVIFSLIFGIACAEAGAAAAPVVRFAEALSEVMFLYTRYVMYLAPAGVFASTAVTAGGRQGEVFAGLARLVGTLYLAELVFALLVYGAVMAVARIGLRGFYLAARQPVLIAFSTCSSAAALPRALENLERFGVPKHILGLVLPLGLSFNLAGSTLYLPLAVLFFAQAAGVQMPFVEQLLLLLALKLSSKGIAAVPRSTFVIVAGTMASFGVPLEGLALILGVDAIMDMIRTGVNMAGNCLACAAVTRWEDRDAPLASVAK
jgi:proton glutamate symport protein